MEINREYLIIKWNNAGRYSLLTLRRVWHLGTMTIILVKLLATVESKPTPMLPNITKKEIILNLSKLLINYPKGKILVKLILIRIFSIRTSNPIRKRVKRSQPSFEKGLTSLSKPWIVMSGSRQIRLPQPMWLVPLQPGWIWWAIAGLKMKTGLVPEPICGWSLLKLSKPMIVFHCLCHRAR